MTQSLGDELNPNNRIAVSILALFALVAGLLVSSAPASAAGELLDDLPGAAAARLAAAHP